MKHHTVILVPHAPGKLRKWHFTTLQANLACGILATLTLAGVVATFLYFDAAFDRTLFDQIEKENVELRQVNQSFERSLRDFGSQLGEYQQQIHKLAIVAGVSDFSPMAAAGIGGPLELEANAVEESDMAGKLARLESWADDLGHNMGFLQDQFEERRLLISRTPAVTPVKGLLTSGFGYRPDPFTRQRTFHSGIDIMASRGKEVRVAGDGFVLKTGWVQGLGNAVFISHGYGITTRYGHLLEILVEEGASLQRGDVIGLVGNTGRSTGNHLHYEVRVDGRPTNPLGYILDRR